MRLSLAEISLLLFLFYCHASSGFENAHKTRLCWVVFNHIPVKLVAFDSAVNVTLGLPIVRTSVDHGTAFDIAYQGKASTTSFVNAYNLAKRLV